MPNTPHGAGLGLRGKKSAEPHKWFRANPHQRRRVEETSLRATLKLTPDLQSQCIARKAKKQGYLLCRNKKINTRQKNLGYQIVPMINKGLTIGADPIGIFFWHKTRRLIVRCSTAETANPALRASASTSHRIIWPYNRASYQYGYQQGASKPWNAASSGLNT